MKDSQIGVRLIRRTVVVIFFLCFSDCFGQPPSLNFAVVDSLVKEIPVSSPDTLSKNLTAAFSTQIDKVRSIFKWIAENIAYDTKGYYNLNSIYNGLFQPTDSLDSGAIYKNYHDNIVKKVLREKVAVCDGYTRLFKTLCDYANIRSEIITGYVRWYTDPIGVQTKRIHAWNAVEVDQTWYFLDVTWGSGYSNSDVTKYKKEFDENYFLALPEKMINDHFPLDPGWLSLSGRMSLENFYEQPYLFAGFKKYKINSFKPALGIIESGVGDKLFFELESAEPGKEMVVVASLRSEVHEDNHVDDTAINISELLKPAYTVTGNKVGCTYTIRSTKTKELYVLYNGELAIQYSVRVKN